MKNWIMIALIIGALLLVFLCRVDFQDQPVQPAQPEVRVNPLPKQRNPNDTTVTVKQKLMIKPDTAVGHNDQPQYRQQTIITNGKTGEIIGKVENPPQVTTGPDGTVVIETKPVDIAFTQPAAGSRLKLVMTAPLDIGLGYALKETRLWKTDLNLDGIITTKQYGLGISLKYHNYYLGTGQTWQFGGGEPRTVYYIGLQTGL